MLDWIKNWFAEQGVIGTVAQLIGFLALAASAISFQQKTQKRIVIGQCICSSLWGVHMLLLGAWAGTLLNVVAAIRAFLYSYREKYVWARHKAWYAVFIALFAACSLFSALQPNGEEWMAILPFVGMTLTTFSLGEKHPFKVRLLTLINCPFWLFYDFFNGSIAGVIAEMINITSIVLAMLRLDLPAHRAKKKVAEDVSNAQE